MEADVAADQQTKMSVMPLDQLPDPVLLQVIARLGLCDAVALSQTCSRLRHLVLHVPGVQGCTLYSVLSAANQRLQAVTGGTWRDALLLAAWQRQEEQRWQQQQRAVAALRVQWGQEDDSLRRLQQHYDSGAGNPKVLQHVLTLPDAAAALVAGQLSHAPVGSSSNSGKNSSSSSSSSSSSGGKSSSSSSVGKSSSSSSGAVCAAITARGPSSNSTEFSLYWQPGQDMVRQANCLVTDGRATALLKAAAGNDSSAAAADKRDQPNSTAAATDIPEAAAAAAAAAAGPSRQGLPASTPNLGPNTNSRVGLLHGHLPPAETYATQPLHQLLFNPAGQSSSSSSSGVGGGIYAGADYERLASLVGLRHLWEYLRYWWSVPLSQPDSSSSSSSSSTPAAAAASTAGEPGNDKDAAAAAYNGPRQILLLPLQPPPGSIPGLQSPWPPNLAPGGTYQGLGNPGCDVTTGFRSCPWVLRDALLRNESALLLPAGVTGSSRLPNMEGFARPPPAWWSQLHHLDLSGQASIGDDVLGTTLSSCSALQSVSIADTAAGPMTFMIWPSRPPAAAGGGGRVSSTAAAAAAAAAAGLSLHARLMQGFSSQQQQPAQPAAAHVGHNTAAAAAGYNLSHVSTTGNPSTANVAISSNSRLTGSGVSAGPAAAPAVSTVPSVVPGAVPSVCSLRVLDVSRCKALAGGAAGAAVYKLFQASLGAMPQLEVLLACRMNVDAAFTCSCQSSLLSKTTASNTAALKPSTGPHMEPHDHQQASSGSNSSSSGGVGGSGSRCSFCSVLSGLLELDVSAATALSVSTLVGLLHGCSSLRRLAVAGCKTLGEGDGATQLEAALADLAQQQQQQQQQDQEEESATPSSEPEESQGVREPSSGSGGSSSSSWSRPVLRIGQGLHRLCVGWGWSAAAISCVLRGSPFLTSFNAGVGACVTDGVLQQLGASCPHLQAMRLSLCTVTHTGVAYIISGCPHLTSLQLQQCVGPFDVGPMMLQPTHTRTDQQQHATPARQLAVPSDRAAAATGEVGSDLAVPVPRRWQLSTLQLAGPRTTCTDERLLQLLGLLPMPADAGRCSSSCGDDNNCVPGKPAMPPTACSSSGTPPRVLHPISMSAKPTAQLTDLCLVRVKGLTDHLLLQLAAAGCKLKHLRLEHCYKTTAGDARLSGGAWAYAGSSSSSSGSGSGSKVVSFSSGAVLQLVADSCALTLRSLTLRHAVALPQDFVFSLVHTAPLLQRLVLDGCDLTGGFELDPDPHGALSTVHVIRCQHVEGHHGPLAAARHEAGKVDTAATAAAETLPAAAASGRVLDRDLVVHMLNLRRSIHLPPG